MTETQDVLATLDGPARVIRSLEHQIGDLHATLSAERADREGAELLVTQLRARIAQLEGATKQGLLPINPAYEEQLARRSAVLRFRFNGSGKKAGRVTVSLEASRSRLLQGDTCEEVITRMIGLEPVVRTGFTRSRDRPRDRQ